MNQGRKLTVLRKGVAMKRLAIQNIQGRFQDHTCMVDIHTDVLLNDQKKR